MSGTPDPPGEALGPVESCPIPGIQGQTWDFLSVGEALLIANNDGVYEVRGETAVLLRKTATTAFTLHASRASPGRVFVGLANGLASLRQGERGWVDEGQVAGFSDDIRTLLEMPDGRLWVGTRASGGLFPDRPRLGYILRVDSRGRIWMSTADEARSLKEVGAAGPGPGGAYRWDPRPLRPISGSLATLHADDDGVVWLGGGGRTVPLRPSRGRVSGPKARGGGVLLSPLPGPRAPVARDR